MLEPLMKYRSHTGKEDPFRTKRLDALLQEILPIHSVSPYVQVAARLQRQEGVCLRKTANVDLATVTHNDSCLLGLLGDRTDLRSMRHPGIAGRNNHWYAERTCFSHQSYSGRVVDRIPFLHRVEHQTF